VSRRRWLREYVLCIELDFLTAVFSGRGSTRRLGMLAQGRGSPQLPCLSQPPTCIMHVFLWKYLPHSLTAGHKAAAAVRELKRRGFSLNFQSRRVCPLTSARTCNSTAPVHNGEMKRQDLENNCIFLCEEPAHEGALPRHIETLRSGLLDFRGQLSMAWTTTMRGIVS
jgi:hypothetical protein